MQCGHFAQPVGDDERREKREARDTMHEAQCASVTGHASTYSCPSLAHCISFQPFKIYKLQATLSQTAPLANSSSNVFVFACACACVCVYVYTTLLPRPYGTVFRRLEEGQCFRGRGKRTRYCVSIYIHTCTSFCV